MPGLAPTIRRHTIAHTDLRRLQTIEDADKFSLIADSTNSVAIRVATEEIGDADAENYHELQPGDALVWESTKPGETLDMDLWARVTSGSAILFVWVWKKGG